MWIVSGVAPCRGPAVSAKGVLATETLLDKMAQTVAQALHAHGVDDVDHKRLHEHHARLALGDTALAHVEQRVGVELPRGRAVGAFHVVVVYLKLRLGVHTGVKGCKYVAVALVGLGELCTRGDKDSALKRAGRLVVKHIFEQLGRVATGHAMVDIGRVVDKLTSGAYRHAGEACLASLTGEVDGVLVARRATDEGHAVDEEVASLLLTGVELAEA